MITEQDLQEAIAECQGERHPNANTCMKLAAFYTIKNELYPDHSGDVTKMVGQPSGYSFAPPPEQVEKPTIDYSSDTEFGRMVHGKDPGKIWPIVDELVSEAVQTFNPRLYAAFLRKIKT